VVLLAFCTFRGSLCFWVFGVSGVVLVIFLVLVVFGVILVFSGFWSIWVCYNTEIAVLVRVVGLL